MSVQTPQAWGASTGTTTRRVRTAGRPQRCSRIGSLPRLRINDPCQFTRKGPHVITHRGKRKPVLLVLCSLWCIVGCVSNNPRNTSGVSDLLVQEAVAFRAPNGLFRPPGVSGAVQPVTWLQALNEGVEKTSGSPTSPPGQGSISATYLFARLLDQRFKEAANSATGDTLYSSLESQSTPVVDRLKAGAALRKLGDERWSEAKKLAIEVAGKQAGPISSQELAGYLEIMEPAAVIDNELPLQALVEFTPGANEQLQRSAWAALYLSYLFSNQQEVTRMFGSMVRDLKEVALDPDTPVPELILAAGVLSASSQVTLEQAESRRIGMRIRENAGCRDSKALYSATGEGSGPCSLMLTLSVRSVPLAVPEEGL